MDESGLFYKALPDTGLAKRLKSVKTVKNQKNDYGIFCVLEGM